MKRGNDYNSACGFYESKKIRDRLKYEYRAFAESEGKCYICGTENTEQGNILDGRSSTGSLKVFWPWSLTLLWQKYKMDNGIFINSEEQMNQAAEAFITDENDKLTDMYVLCEEHYKKAHSIYGKTIALHYAKKCVRWLGIMRGKHI